MRAFLSAALLATLVGCGPKEEGGESKLAPAVVVSDPQTASGAQASDPSRASGKLDAVPNGRTGR